MGIASVPLIVPLMLVIGTAIWVVVMGWRRDKRLEDERREMATLHKTMNETAKAIAAKLGVAINDSDKTDPLL